MKALEAANEKPAASGLFIELLGCTTLSGADVADQGDFSGCVHHKLNGYRAAGVHIPSRLRRGANPSAQASDIV